MKDLFNIFPLFFSGNIFVILLFTAFIASYVVIAIFQIRKSEKTLFVSLAFAVILGLVFMLFTSLLENDTTEDDINILDSLISWFTLAWNVFMVLLLVVLPLYVFSMVSTSFTNARHHEHGKKILIVSFFALLGMTLLGIFTAILLLPIMIALGDLLNLEIATTGSGALSMGSFLSSYSTLIIISIILAIVFAIVMNILHKYKHNSGERIIAFVERIKNVIREYLNVVTYLVPYVLIGMLIVIFNNYNDAFFYTLQTLIIFILLFGIGLTIITGIEFGIISTGRRSKKTIPRKEFRKKSREYTTKVFAVQSAPVLYPITKDYVEFLGVSESVSETVPTLSTFMGYSTCGGFYPALIILFTLLQSHAGADGLSIAPEQILNIVLLMIPLIVIMTLGMTGVPGADVAIVLGLLSTLGLNPNYFFTIYPLDALLDKVRGIGNSFGFSAASVITERIVNPEHKTKTEELSVE